MNQKKGTAAAVGNFDGFHLGHRKLVETLKQAAVARDLPSMIITFVPNPKVYFKQNLNLISSDAQKKQLIENLDVDRIVFLDFKQIFNLSGAAFVKEILVDRFNVKFIVMGENFRFGKNRAGDVDTLEKMGRDLGFESTVVTPVRMEGTPISSSLIRRKLGNAEIEYSNRMLGREYYVDGIVTGGDKIGRQLGFPTINIDTDNEILPEGVFKTRTEAAGKVYDSISYIGSSPTFAGKEKKVETHIFDFEKNIYGQTVRVYFEKKLR
ncbi:MAG: bifunctional riboflavin kinase/FAD synthetase, partial [bacterium]|nr:bifunctional riboflavin kinase/FAD synthetase [bacterium]